jgi:chromate transporter
MTKTPKVRKIKRLIFLKDVFIIAVSAFGGPAMHIALFVERMVEKKKYLTESELYELYSLSQILPGPSSTQTITAMGYKFGGKVLAFLTLIVWILPAFILMSLFSFIYHWLDADVATQTFRYVQPLAVAFVIYAAFKMVKSIAKSRMDIGLIIMAFVGAALLRHPLEPYVKTPWIFPVLLAIGGLISYFTNKNTTERKKVTLKIPWRLLAIFIGIFIATGLAVRFTDLKILRLFENTYRFGSLVFGGGNVLIPMMFEQFVSYNGYMDPDQFLNGVGLKQAIPGPIFTITSYMTGLSMYSEGPMWQIVGCFVGTIGIFLPGTLMIFFVYPIWENVKEMNLVRRSIGGVIATSAGLVMAAAYLLFLPVGLDWVEPGNFYYTNLRSVDFIHWKNIGIISVMLVFLFKTELPAPFWVFLAILAGIFF